MVGEAFGVVLRTAKRLDPLCRLAVLLGAFRAGDLAVSDVADEDMPEGELVVAAY